MVQGVFMHTFTFIAVDLDKKPWEIKLSGWFVK
jgi:hypothetical protein